MNKGADMDNAANIKALIANAKNCHRDHLSMRRTFKASEFMRNAHKHSKGMRDGFFIAARLLKGYGTKAEHVNAIRRRALERKAA